MLQIKLCGMQFLAQLVSQPVGLHLPRKSYRLNAVNIYLFHPYRITFPEAPDSKKRKHDEEEPKEAKQELMVEPFVVPNRGPYPFNQPKK